MDTLDIGASPARVVRHLLGRRLVTSDAVLRDGFSISELSGRNRVLRVTLPGGRGYLLKQGVGAEGREAVAHEADVYRLLARAPAGVSGALPRLEEYDPAAGILVLALVPGAVKLSRSQPRRSSFAAATELGAFLAELHAWGGRLAEGRTRPVAGVRFTGRPPWVLSIDRPAPRDLRTLSGGNLELIRSLQRSHRLGEALATLRRDWRPLTLVHHDLRLENCLVRRHPGSGRVKAFVVDWELADLGDPAWDVGSVLAGWIGRPVRPEALGGSSDRLNERILPEADAEGAARAFWSAYLGREPATPTLRDLVPRAFRFAGARLIQAAFEGLQSRPHASADVGRLLSLARDFLLDPDGSLERRFGPGAVPSLSPRTRALRPAGHSRAVVVS